MYNYAQYVLVPDGPPQIDRTPEISFQNKWF